MLRGLRFRIPSKDGSDTIMHDASFSEENPSLLQTPSRQCTEPQLGELLHSLPQGTQTQTCSSYATQSQFEQLASTPVPKPFQYTFPRRTTPEFGQTWQYWAKTKRLTTTSPQSIQNQYVPEPSIEPPLSPSKRKVYTSQLQLPNVLRPEALNIRSNLKHAEELWVKIEDFVNILRTLNPGIEIARGQYHEAWNLAIQHSLKVLIQLGYTIDNGQERKFIDSIEKWILKPNIQCVTEEARSLDLDTRRKTLLSLVQSPEEVGKEKADLTKKALEDQYRQITHTERSKLQQSLEERRTAEDERAENVQSQWAQAQTERRAEMELQLSLIIDEARERKRARAEAGSRDKQRKKQVTQQRLEAEAMERDRKLCEKERRLDVEAERAKKKEKKRARHEALMRQRQLAKAKKQEAKAANVVYDNWVKGAPFVPLVLYVQSLPEPMNAVPPPSAAAKKKGGKSGGGMGKAMNKEGTIVGARAPEIAAGNKGRAMLEKMGWTAGTGLGANDNKGITAPVEVVVKHSTLGLGATFSSVRGARIIGTSRVENSSFASGGTFQL